MSKVRVNIHPRPIDTDWDISIPYHGNSYNQSNHVLDEYLNQFLASVPIDSNVVLVSNRESISRQIAVKKIISSHYKFLEIEESDNPRCQEKIFIDHPYAIIDKPIDTNEKEILEFYINNWTNLSYFSRRYEYASHGRDHGYFPAVKRRWYQWGIEMPPPLDELHREMYKKFDLLFKKLLPILKEKLSPLRISDNDLAQGLMFRLNHNPPGSQDKGHLVNRHGDNSIVSIWMAQSFPGAMIDRGQEFPIDSVSINDLYDTTSQYLMFPGFDYCDVAETSTPATWHSVLESDSSKNRVSIVAFLKYL